MDGFNEEGTASDGAGRFALLGMEQATLSRGVDQAQTKGDKLALAMGMGMAQPKRTRPPEFNAGWASL